MPRKRKEQSDNYNKAFPTALRKLMDYKKTTQNELAEYLQKTRQSISYYCDGSSSPDWETLVKIADYFDVSTDYLLGRTADPNRLPCAADDLGLSAESVRLMWNFLHCTSIGNDGLEGLNLLIEKGFLLQLTWQIKLFCDHVAEDIALSKKYTKASSNDDSDSKIERIRDDLDIIDDITKLAIEHHPEYQDRFRVFTGYRFIAAEKRELVDTFERTLREVSGYDSFLAELPDKGIWL